VPYLEQLTILMGAARDWTGTSLPKPSLNGLSLLHSNDEYEQTKATILSCNVRHPLAAANILHDLLRCLSCMLRPLDNNKAYHLTPTDIPPYTFSSSTRPHDDKQTAQCLQSRGSGRLSQINVWN
jgi:hypothetical protein